MKNTPFEVALRKARRKLHIFGAPPRPYPEVDADSVLSPAPDRWEGMRLDMAVGPMVPFWGRCTTHFTLF